MCVCVFMCVPVQCSLTAYCPILLIKLNTRKIIVITKSNSIEFLMQFLHSSTQHSEWNAHWVLPVLNWNWNVWEKKETDTFSHLYSVCVWNRPKRVAAIERTFENDKNLSHSSITYVTLNYHAYSILDYASKSIHSKYTHAKSILCILFAIRIYK